MINNEEKITTSKLNTTTIKTVLFAGLIMTLMIPITGMNLAEAQNTSTDKIPDDIPKERILERDFQKWNNKYANEDEFNIKQASINSYTASDLPQNGWNQYMQKAAIIIHNFETINENVGSGYELVGLFAAKDRLLNTYDVSEPILKLHDWAISEYDVPTSVAEIDDRIALIVSEKYLHLVPEYISVLNNMAEHGSVPDELHDQDSEYWIMIANVSVCSYDTDCDLSLMQNILNNESYRTQDKIIPTIDVMDIVLPKAYAVTYVLSYGYLFVDPYDCEYSSTCEVSTSGSGTNPYNLNIFTSQSDEHSFGNSIDIYASTCSSGSGNTAKVTGDLEAKGGNYPIWAQNLNCAIDDRTINLGGNPGASWFWDASTTHKAWS